MKKILAVLFATLSFATFAHEIEGVQLLKGSLKTDVYVGAVKSSCKVKISKVKNQMVEDSFGNPAFSAEVSVSLSGKKVDFDKSVLMSNLFADGVRDLEFQGEGILVKIDNEGRLTQVQIPYKNSKVVCNF